MNHDRLLRLFGLWEQGFRSHVTAELIEHGATHEVARFAAQLALDHGSNVATDFCELVERWETLQDQPVQRRAS